MDLEIALTDLVIAARDHGSLTREVVTLSPAAHHPVVETAARRSGRDSVEELLATTIEAASTLSPKTPSQRTDLAIRAALNLLPDMAPGTDAAARLKALATARGVHLRTVQRWGRLGAAQLVESVKRALELETLAPSPGPSGGALGHDVPPYHALECNYQVHLGATGDVSRVVRRMHIVPEERAMDYFKMATSYRGTDGERHYAPISFVSHGTLHDSLEAPGISVVAFDPPRPAGVAFWLEVERDYSKGTPPRPTAQYESRKRIDRLTFELRWAIAARPTRIWHYQDIFSYTDSPEYSLELDIALIPDQHSVRWSRPDPPKPGLVTGISWSLDS